MGPRSPRQVTYTARWGMRIRSFGVAVTLVLGLATAHADPTPWSAGVSEVQKAQAKIALDDGNALFLDKKYGEALAKYQAAIASWDHPAIRFNVVRCLIQLDRPVEASDNLKLALKYGAAPLEEGVYTEALSYEKLLANQIGELAITCTQPGVKLTLDGQPLATCPAKEQRRVTPGPHQLVGVKDGFLTRTLELVIIGGRSQAVSIALEPASKAARIVHRWPTWIPWVVFGGGFAMAGIGGVLNLSAAGDMDSYDLIVQQQCAERACTEEELAPFKSLEEDARFRSRVAVGVMIAGAGTIATGAVMLYLNRGRTIYPRGIERVTPSVSPISGGAAFTLSGRF